MIDTKETEQALALEVVETQAANRYLKTIVIQEEQGLSSAAKMAQDVKARFNSLESQRTSITKPLLEAKRKVDQLFKPTLDALKETETILKSAMGLFTHKREQERAALMQASAAQYASGGTPTAIIPEPAQANGVTVRHRWAFRIVDAASVPAEYCSPDLRKIEAAIWYADTPTTPPRPIPGIEFYPEQSVTVRQDK